MIFSVGMKARLVSDVKKKIRELEVKGIPTGGFGGADMQSHSGNIVTIAEVVKRPITGEIRGYRIEEDNDSYYWVKHLFLPVDKNILFDEMIRGSISRKDYEESLEEE